MRWLAFLLVATAVSAISSSEAIEALGQCMTSNNPQLSGLPTALLAGGDPYWVFYYPTTSGRRLFAAVSDQDGNVITEEPLLIRLADGVYHRTVFEDVIQKRGWSAENVNNVLDDAQRRVLSEQRGKLAVFRQDTEERYPALQLESIERSLDAVETRLQNAQSLLADASSQQQLYEGNPTAEDGIVLLNSYNNSFTALFELFTAVDAHNKAISKAEEDVYRLAVPDPDNKNINSNLENLRELGLSSLYSKAKASNPATALSRALADSQKWSDDGVKSFLFQDLSCRANAAYQDAKPKYTQVVDAENELRRAGFSAAFDDVKEDWSRVEVLRQKRTAESYDQLLTFLPSLTKKIETLRADYARQNEGPLPTAKPTNTGPDGNTLLIFLVLVALVGWGFWQYKKKQQEAEEQGLS